MSEPSTAQGPSKIFRTAIWIAIGALIAAAIVCVVWVLIGDANGLVGRAFLTVLLLAAFAGVALLEANLAPRREPWFALASMVSWVAALIVGAFLIWMPLAPGAYGVERFGKFLLIVLIIQGALLHIRLYSRAFARYQTTFTSVVAYVTMSLVVILAIMLILPLMVEEFFDFRPIYWRIVVSIAILAAVGTALVPLVNALFAPKTPRAPKPAAVAAPAATAPAAVQAWPTYADGRTPLPVMPDGSPDWNAYYTGQPTYPYGYPQTDAAPQDPSAAAQPDPYAAQPAPATGAPEFQAPEQPAAAPAPHVPESPEAAQAPQTTERAEYPPAPPVPPQPPLPPQV